MIQARRMPAQPKKEYISPHYNNSSRNTKHKPKLKENFSLFMVTVLFIILAIVAVALYSKIVTTSFEVSRVQGELAALQEEQRELELEVSNLHSMERIEKIARNELKMEDFEDRPIRTVSQEQLIE